MNDPVTTSPLYHILGNNWTETREWKCYTLFCKIVEKKRIFKFLIDLNKFPNEICGQNLSTKPLPTLQEAFSKVHSEESQKQVMLGPTKHPPAQNRPALIS